MPRENTAPSLDRIRASAKGLHLASANASVITMSTLSTTNLRIVARNDGVRAVAVVDETDWQSRKSLIRMGIAAAAAPVLWLAHAVAQQIHHGF